QDVLERLRARELRRIAAPLDRLEDPLALRLGEARALGPDDDHVALAEVLVEERRHGLDLALRISRRAPHEDGHEPGARQVEDRIVRELELRDVAHREPALDAEEDGPEEVVGDARVAEEDDERTAARHGLAAAHRLLDREAAAPEPVEVEPPA